MNKNSTLPPELQAEELDAEQLLLKRLHEHGLLMISRSGVRVHQGIAYIRGYVPNIKQKKLATELAMQTKGVYGVVNMLRITPVAILDDLSLEKHIRDTLSRNYRLDEFPIVVRVTNGHVYLGGSVTTAAEKILVEHEVWATPGVKGITNNIKVRAEAHKSKNEVIEEIRRGLSDCLGLDTSTIEIQFQNGIVRLRGTVSSEYSKEAAEELALWISQVKAVINELQVGESSHLESRYVPEQTGFREKENYLHDIVVS